VYSYDWNWCCHSQINVSIYLTDVICKAIGECMFCCCSGMELGLTTGLMSLNQQPANYKAQKQQESCCYTQNQVQVELLLVFWNTAHT
jgi:hypothetical protein